MNLLFNISNLNSNFAPTLGYFNPVLNNSAQMSTMVNLGIGFQFKSL